MKNITTYIIESSQKQIMSYLNGYFEDIKDKDFIDRFLDKKLTDEDLNNIKNYLMYDLDEKSVNKLVTFEFLYTTYMSTIQKRKTKINNVGKVENQVIDIFYDWFIKYAKGKNDLVQVIDDYRYERKLTGASKEAIKDFRKAIDDALELLDYDEIDPILKDIEHLGDHKNDKAAIERVKNYFGK